MIDSPKWYLPPGSKARPMRLRARRRASEWRTRDIALMRKIQRRMNDIRIPMKIAMWFASAPKMILVPHGFTRDPNDPSRVNYDVQVVNHPISAVVL